MDGFSPHERIEDYDATTFQGGSDHADHIAEIVERKMKMRGQREVMTPKASPENEGTENEGTAPRFDGN